MKKVKSVKRGSAAKRDRAPKTPRNTPKTIDDYFARVARPARTKLNQMRTAIRSAVPREATETISYGIPAFKHKRVLVWFAAFANHCSLFPGSSVIESFKNELKGFHTSKGTIHFPLDKPLPAALIKKLVHARVTQIEAQPR